MSLRRRVLLLGAAWLALAGPAAASEVRSGSFHAAALGAEMRYTVYLPDGYDSGSGQRRYPVLYLLHGHGGDEHDWLRQGALQATADRLIGCGAVPPLIVVMPAGGNSWWVDSPHAAAQTALVRDLVAHTDSRLRTLAAREGRLIAGLSAGGYGTLLAVMKYPQLYAAAAAFSPAVYVPVPPPVSAARRVPAPAATSAPAAKADCTG